MRAERLLPIACIAAAALLAASELMTTFHFTPPGGVALCAQQASDRHYYAPFVLAVFASVCVVIAVASGSKPAAAAVAVAGGLALLIFLTIDLPDANNVGTLGNSCGPAVTDLTAKAVPQTGFWFEMVGALLLALCGTALATLTPEQLSSLREVRFGRRGRSEPPAPPPPSLSDEPERGTAEASARAERRTYQR